MAEREQLQAAYDKGNILEFHGLSRSALPACQDIKEKEQHVILNGFKKEKNGN